jgi:hypothetical protein
MLSLMLALLACMDMRKISNSEVVKSSVCECLVGRVSKLQTKIALSTMEVEVIALAHCCRELFPIIDLVMELGKVLGRPD